MAQQHLFADGTICSYLALILWVLALHIPGAGVSRTPCSPFLCAHVPLYMSSPPPACLQSCTAQDTSLCPADKKICVNNKCAVSRPDQHALSAAAPLALTS